MQTAKNLTFEQALNYLTEKQKQGLYAIAKRNEEPAEAVFNRLKDIIPVHK